MRFPKLSYENGWREYLLTSAWHHKIFHCIYCSFVFKPSSPYIVLAPVIILRLCTLYAAIMNCRVNTVGKVLCKLVVHSKILYHKMPRILWLSVLLVCVIHSNTEGVHLGVLLTYNFTPYSLSTFFLPLGKPYTTWQLFSK